MLKASSPAKAPTLLAASAVAVIIPSSGTSNATGQITHTTALPAQPVGTVRVFLPAGVVTAGSQGTGAGLYSVTYSSTTVCQLTGTGIVTANAAYTQVTTEVILATDTVPAGAMGLNGSLLLNVAWTGPNSVNSKTPRVRFGGIGGVQYYNAAFTTTVCAGFPVRLRNRGAANAQVGGCAPNVTPGVGASASALPTGSVDTSLSQDLVHTAQLAVATEFMILESRETWLIP